MRRKDLLCRLKAAGLQCEEGDNHARVLMNGKLVAAVPRHTEANGLSAKKILTDAGLNEREHGGGRFPSA